MSVNRIFGTDRATTFSRNATRITERLPDRMEVTQGGPTLQLLEYVDDMRPQVAPGSARNQKSALGQFMTGESVARFMASLFEDRPQGNCRLLDPGASLGALSCAFLDRWAAGELHFDSVELHGYELDPKLGGLFSEALRRYEAYLKFSSKIILGDFIEHATSLFAPSACEFTHVIMNPPYKKINSNSHHRSMLRQAGIETVNLYSAFLALAVSLAAQGGQIVAIVPRSFCNGQSSPKRSVESHSSGVLVLVLVG